MAFGDVEPDKGKDSNHDDGTTKVDVSNDKSGGDKSPFLVVGERAYHTQDDVVKHLGNAQAHISTIEAENASLREQNTALEATANSGAKVEDVLEHLRKQDSQNPEGDTSGSTENWSEVKKEIKEEIKAENMQASVAVQAASNVAKAEEIAKQVYGDSYEAEIATKAKSLNMSMDEVNRMAETNTTIWSKLFIPLDKLPKNSEPMSKDINTNLLVTPPTDDGLGGKSFMRAKAVDRSREIQRRMLEKTNTISK